MIPPPPAPAKDAKDGKAPAKDAKNVKDAAPKANGSAEAEVPASEAKDATSNSSSDAPEQAAPAPTEELTA